MAISTDVSTEPSQEPIASCDTALSCLMRLAERQGDDPQIEALRRRVVVDGNSLPASRLIKLAEEFGLQGEFTQLDWQALTSEVLSHPILVFLKNTNVVVVVGSAAGKTVSVWDPLHSDGQVFPVPRQEFERAWSGYTLIMTRQPPAPAPASAGSGSESPNSLRERGSRRARKVDEQMLPTGAPAARRAMSGRLAAIGVAAAVGVGVLVFMRTVPDNGATSATKPQGTDQTVAGSGFATAETVAHSADRSATSAPIGLAEETATGAAAPASPKPAGGPTAAVATASGAAASEAGSVAIPPEPPAEPTPAMATPAVNGTATPLSAAALSTDEIAALVARGDVLFGKGDLAAARLFYERAADAGDGPAAVRLGETFDPVFLDRAQLRGVRGQAQTALSWYRRARDLGVADAEVLLKSLEANLER
jgi:Peptidase C39 family